MLGKVKNTGNSLCNGYLGLHGCVSDIYETLSASDYKN